MKSIAVAILILAVVNLSIGDDNGQYQPGKYGDDGKYRGEQDAQYYDTNVNVYARDNQYYRYNPYSSQQKYFKNLSPYNQLLTPYTDYRNRLEQQASSLASVTSRPPVFASTARPIIYTTPTNVVPVYRAQYNNEGNARIVAQESDADEKSYSYKYLTENGISAGENGVVDAVSGVIRTSGFYEYIGDDGLTYRVDYTADENGFHPTGAHLP